MARKIYLHTGKHKTGSSSIQRYLESNEDFFQDLGFTLITNTLFLNPRRRMGPKYNCYNLAHILIRPELMTPVRIRGFSRLSNYPDQSKRAEKINKLLKETAGDALIISAESFSFLRTAEERALFDTVFADFDVHPITFFRESVAWMNSWEKQLSMLVAKKKKYNIGLSKGTIFDFSPDSWMLDDDAIKDFFHPNGHSFSYDDAIEKHGNVIPVFLKELGLTVSACPSWENIWYNRTLK